MDEVRMDEVLDGAAEVEGLLRYNGFSFRREGERFRLVFSEGGRKWETMFVCRDRLVLIYGRYPFPAGSRERAESCCHEINRQVVMGSMFLLEGHVVFRTGVDLFDAYSAYEHIGRALEYNAGVMTRFWSQIAACAPGNAGDPGGMPASE